MVVAKAKINVYTLILSTYKLSNYNNEKILKIEISNMYHCPTEYQGTVKPHYNYIDHQPSG